MVDVVQEYALLTARAARLIPGLAEVPPAARRRVAVEPQQTASALVRAAGQLRMTVPGAGLDASRARFLAAQLRAVECTARRLAGQEIEFVAEVADTFGVTVRAGSTDGYRRAHRDIADLLPGRGPLCERLARHRLADTVPPDQLLPALRLLSAELGDRTRARWPLPTGESVEYRLVPDAPWTALHTWLGGRSVVRVSVAARLRWAQLPQLVAHEAYPGHHTQRCRAEGAPWPEHRVAVVRSPQSVVAEGVAEAGLDVLVGPGWGRWAEEVLDGLLGRRFDPLVAERLERAVRELAPVRLDAALLSLGSRGSTEDATRHLRRWLLVGEERARRIVGALAVPLWRGHVAAHVAGPPLVNSWLRSGSRPVTDRYRRLLDEPVVPADLVSDPAEAAGRCAADRAP